MRILLITLWLLVPLGFAAFHYGPGQEHLKLDLAEDLLSKGRQAVKAKDWATAIESYQEALTKLPPEKRETSVKIQIEIAKAKMQNSGLPEAREDLIQLVTELKDDSVVSSEVKADALSTLANSRYYMTYLMKLEGLPPAQWEPEIEAARQEYKLLAQTTPDKQRHLNDLEAAIRLARADPKELYGLPIPGQ